MNKEIKKYRYPFLLFSLVNLLLIPMWESILFIPSSLIVVLSYTLIIISGIFVNERKGTKYWVIFLGAITLFCIWIEFVVGSSELIVLSRISFSLLLFLFLFCSLTMNILKVDEICMEMIVAVMSGFLFLGILGGVVYEFNETLHPGSLSFSAYTGNYAFYYFSFINLTSIGFGEIYPQTAMSQSITVMLGILGQFYLAFGVTVFVGKFLNQQVDKNSN